MLKTFIYLINVLQIPRHAHGLPIWVGFTAFDYGFYHREHITCDNASTFGFFHIHGAVTPIRNPVTLVKDMIVKMCAIRLFVHIWHQNLVGAREARCRRAMCGVARKRQRVVEFAQKRRAVVATCGHVCLDLGATRVRRRK